MLGNYKRWECHNNLDDLSDIQETKKPRTVGASWKKVPHKDVVAGLVRALSTYGLTMCKTGIRFYLCRGGADIAFSAIVKNDEVGSVNTRVKKTTVPLYPSIGFIASNAHRQGLLFFGGFASEKQNLSHVTQKARGAKYTTSFDPNTEGQEFVDSWVENLGKFSALNRDLQEATINYNQIARYMTEAGSKNLMPWSRAGRILDSVHSASCTKWSLLMKFSEMVAMNPPMGQMDQLYHFSQLIQDIESLVKDKTKEQENQLA